MLKSGFFVWCHDKGDETVEERKRERINLPEREKEAKPQGFCLSSVESEKMICSISWGREKDLSCDPSHITWVIMTSQASRPRIPTKGNISYKGHVGCNNKLPYGGPLSLSIGWHVSRCNAAYIPRCTILAKLPPLASKPLTARNPTVLGPVLLDPAS